MALGERLSGRKVIASELFSRLWILSVPAISCGVPAGLRNLLEERNFTWRMCRALTSDTTGRSPEVYRQAVKTRLSPLSSSLLADGLCRRIHREVPPCLHFPALNLGR
jgi:hypothetical protein